jgi:hypothetical protein
MRLPTRHPCRLGLPGMAWHCQQPGSLANRVGRRVRGALIDDRIDQAVCECWPGVRRRAVKAEPALTPGRGGAQRSRLDTYTARFGNASDLFVRSQRATWLTTTLAELTCLASFADIRWRPLVSMAVVTHLVINPPKRAQYKGGPAVVLSRRHD